MDLAWGAGLALGVWISLGVSQGHINPAVTLSQAVFRRFPWRKVPEYMIAQLLGAWMAALIVYGNYNSAIAHIDNGVKTVPGTAAFFATFPAGYVSNVNAFFEVRIP